LDHRAAELDGSSGADVAGPLMGILH
jgi:hypothetical protein